MKNHTKKIIIILKFYFTAILCVDFKFQYNIRVIFF